MFDASLLAELRRLKIRARRRINAVTVGEYAAQRHGHGMEFDQVREYTPGDDVRSIDWNVTARTGVAHVKLFRQELQQTVMLLVDVSGSQEFNSGAQSKRRLALELAAVLVMLAEQQQDRVGLILFSDRIEKFYPPRRASAWQLLYELSSYKKASGGSRLDLAVEQLLRFQKSRCLSVLISDFWMEDIDKPLAQLAAKHELWAVITRLKSEERIAKAGLVEFEDSESKRRFLIDTNRAGFQKKQQALIKAQREHLISRFAKSSVRWSELSSSSDISKCLRTLLTPKG